MASRIALITGTNSGVGLALSIQLAKNGWTVWSTMRSLAKKDELLKAAAASGVESNVFVDEMDVNSDESVENSVKRLVESHKKGPELLVNNAGYALFGSLEMLTMEQMQDQMNANYFGCVRTTKAVLPYMRENQKGKIVNVSSIGGVHGQPFNDVYCASKFAVEGMVEAQAPLFRTFGVYVTSVQPGGIRSAFTANAVRPDVSNLAKEYQGPIQCTMAAYKKAINDDPEGKMSQSPDEVAQAIIDKVVDVAEPPVKIQTNPNIQGVFEMKSSDVDGSKGAAANTTRFLTPSSM